MKLFLGFKCEKTDGWASHVGEIKAPGNYKKQDVIDAYIEKQAALVAERAPFMPLLGQVARVVILKSELDGGGVLFDGEAYDAYELLTDLLRKGEELELFGFDIRQRMHLTYLTRSVMSGDPVDSWGLFALASVTSPNIPFVDKVQYFDVAKLIVGNTQQDPIEALGRFHNKDNIATFDNPELSASNARYAMKFFGVQ